MPVSRMYSRARMSSPHTSSPRAGLGMDVQVGWNIILCKMSAVRGVNAGKAVSPAGNSARLMGTPRKDSDDDGLPINAHAVALQMSLIDRRPSHALTLQMRGSGSLKPKGEDFWQHAIGDGHNKAFAAENAGRL